jgi:hypothetical protein
MNFLRSSVIGAEESEDFPTLQQAQIRAFRAAHAAGSAARVSRFSPGRRPQSRRPSPVAAGFIGAPRMPDRATRRATSCNYVTTVTSRSLRAILNP